MLYVTADVDKHAATGSSMMAKPHDDGDDDDDDDDEARRVLAGVKRTRE